MTPLDCPPSNRKPSVWYM